MPGMDHGDAMSSMDHGSATTRQTPVAAPEVRVALLDPPSFAARMVTGAVLLNVHVPFEGDIEGTNLSIPFGTIANSTKLLPADRDTPILVYCRSGRMSAIASKELNRLGYRDVSDLDGGMVAWEKSGRPVVGLAKPRATQLADPTQ